MNVKKNDYVNFLPAWQHRWTAAQAEVALKDFVFKGAGWYFTKTDTMLVVPGGGDVFLFMVWNEPSLDRSSPSSPYHAVTDYVYNVGTRSDER